MGGDGNAADPALKEYYIKLNKDYYGDELVTDKELEIEWARIPPFLLQLLCLSVCRA